MMLATLLALAAAGDSQTRSTPALGQNEGRCRAGADDPSFLITVTGLKDRRGLMKVEVYPDNDQDFLADDNKLVDAGKTFRRVEIPVPATGPVSLCVRLPHAGRYSVMVLHDRDANHKFGLSSDGVGFAGNPHLGLSKPHAPAAAATARDGPTPLSIILNYRRGLFSFGPIGK